MLICPGTQRSVAEGLLVAEDKSLQQGWSSGPAGSEHAWFRSGALLISSY